MLNLKLLVLRWYLSYILNSQYEIKMKKCLIVGANSDIGYELTKILASKKNKLILISRNISRLELKKKILEKNII